MEHPKRIEIRRLCDLSDWEFYDVAEPGFENPVYTIGLRSYSELRQVEYEVWAGSGTDETPRATGIVDCDEVEQRWCDEVRARVLRNIVIAEHEKIAPCVDTAVR